VDARTSVESTGLSAVLVGEIDQLLEAAMASDRERPPERTEPARETVAIAQGEQDGLEAPKGCMRSVIEKDVFLPDGQAFARPVLSTDFSCSTRCIVSSTIAAINSLLPAELRPIRGQLPACGGRGIRG
jgi:hypothetical protein